MPRAISRTPTEVRSIARSHTDMAIRTLAGIAMQKSAPTAARVTACGILLDRGWGKTPLAVVGPDGGDIKITIRRLITDEDVDRVEQKTIEHIVGEIINHAEDSTDVQPDEDEDQGQGLEVIGSNDEGAAS